jgi:hypothetical protein
MISKAKLYVRAYVNHCVGEMAEINLFNSIIYAARHNNEYGPSLLP